MNTNPSAAAYRDAISALGFVPIGKLRDLDGIPTIPGGKLCLGMECLDRGLWEFEPVFDLIRSLGIHRVRLQSGWQRTEQVKGVYDFSWLDRIVDPLVEAGIEPFLSLSFGNQLYCTQPEKYPNLHIGGLGFLPVTQESEREAWTRYVEAAVTHFKGRITHFEIWNEPDVTAFCVDSDWSTPYMELVKLTSPIIRRVYPEAVIISCTATLAAMQQLVEMGVGDWVDIHSFHYYRPLPEAMYGEVKNKISHLKKIAPKLRFWRGEAGYPSYNDPRSRGALSALPVTEMQQVKFVLRHLLCDMENDELDCTSYFHAYDFEHFLKLVRYHYGVIRHEDHSRKPSYYGLQVLAHLFDGKVENCPDPKLSFIFRRDSEMSGEELLSIRFAGFRKNDQIFYAYHLPVSVGDEVIARRVPLTLPFLGDVMPDPVILDPMTREIYPVTDPVEFMAPLTDYPLFVLDRSMIDHMADLEDSAERTHTLHHVGQIVEE